jgi:hypothetical protein
MSILALSSAREAGIAFVITCAIYILFLLLGVAMSSYATFASCQKTDAAAHFRQSAFWALYPSVSYFIIRSLEILRMNFDKVYRNLDTSEPGKDRAGWVSIGYVMTLACLAGLFALIDFSVEAVCIPTIDEATRFKEDMLKRQAEKAAIQEKTPALE